MSTERVEIKVFNAAGKEIGSHQGDAGVFAAKVTPALIHQAVRWQRAKKRAGTHSVLTRAEMSGGGAKPWKQKGTGRARAGSNTSPLWVGGGVAHGPKVRKYDFRLNKKEKRRALCSAIAVRNSEGNLLIVDDLGLSGIKTQKAAAVLAAIGIERGEKAVVVVGSGDVTAQKSLRNLPGIKVLPAEGVNVYDVINARYLVIVGEDVLQALEARLGAQ